MWSDHAECPFRRVLRHRKMNRRVGPMARGAPRCYKRQTGLNGLCRATGSIEGREHECTMATPGRPPSAGIIEDRRVRHGRRARHDRRGVGDVRDGIGCPPTDTRSRHRIRRWQRFLHRGADHDLVSDASLGGRPRQLVPRHDRHPARRRVLADQGSDHPSVAPARRSSARPPRSGPTRRCQRGRQARLRRRREERRLQRPRDHERQRRAHGWRRHRRQPDCHRIRPVGQHDLRERGQRRRRRRGLWVRTHRTIDVHRQLGGRSRVVPSTPAASSKSSTARSPATPADAAARIAIWALGQGRDLVLHVRRQHVVRPPRWRRRSLQWFPRRHRFCAHRHRHGRQDRIRLLERTQVDRRELRRQRRGLRHRRNAPHRDDHRGR